MESYVGTAMTALKREYEERVGQVTESDAYFSLGGVAYDQDAFSLGTLNTNYYASHQDYDAQGRLERAQNGVGTITRSAIDVAGHILSKWVGTGDSLSTALWTASSGDTPQLFTDSTTLYSNNMARVEAYAYDELVSGNGDGTLTTATQYLSSSSTDTRVTKNYYDWRDRLIIQRQGVESTQGTAVNRSLTLTEYDNLDHMTASETYDGDAITSVTTTDGLPTIATTYRKSRAETAYDEQGRVYQTVQRTVNQSTGDFRHPAMTI